MAGGGKRRGVAGCVLAAAVLLWRPPAAGAGGEPRELTDLREAYRQRVADAMEPVQARHLRRLHGLRDSLRAAGRFAEAEAVQRRIVWMAGEDPVPVPAEEPEPLELDAAEREYGVFARNALAPVDAWYLAQLGALERWLVQRGNAEGARAVRAAMPGDPGAEQTASAVTPGDALGRLSEWEAPFGGDLRVRDGEISLAGPGRGDPHLLIALALFGRELGPEHRIAGRCLLEGDSGGFVFGSRRQFVSVYWSRGSAWVVHHQGRARTVLARPSFAWKPGVWQAFEIVRSGGELRVTVEGVTERFDLPRGCRGTQFGLLTHYEPSVFRVRGLSLDR